MRGKFRVETIRDLRSDDIAVRRDGGSDSGAYVGRLCPKFLAHTRNRLCRNPLYRPLPSCMDKPRSIVHRIIKEHRNTVRITEQERNAAVIRDHRVRICACIVIVAGAPPRITPQNTHNLRAVHLTNGTDTRGIRSDRTQIARTVLPYMGRIVSDMQRHVERIERHRTHAAVARRESMDKAIFGKNIELSAPEIIPHMPQYKTHPFILSALRQTPHRSHPLKHAGVAFSACARIYSCQR